MPRIRTVKPKFFKSDDVTPLSYRARLTWIGLWTYADDEGRGVDNARLIKGELWPLEDDVSWEDVEADLNELHEADRISRYIVDGRRFLVIRKWEEHQVISRATASKLPEPTADSMWFPSALSESSVSAPAHDTAGIGSGSGTGNREGEEEPPRSAAVTDFPQFWSVYPRLDDRKRSEAAYIKARRRATAATIIEGAIRYRDDPNRDPTYTKHAPTWLNGDCWNDPPLPDRGGGRKPTAAERNLSVVQELALEAEHGQTGSLEAPHPRLAG